MCHLIIAAYWDSNSSDEKQYVSGAFVAKCCVTVACIISINIMNDRRYAKDCAHVCRRILHVQMKCDSFIASRLCWSAVSFFENDRQFINSSWTLQTYTSLSKWYEVNIFS